MMLQGEVWRKKWLLWQRFGSLGDYDYTAIVRPWTVLFSPEEKLEVKAQVGPDREHADLQAWETDAFTGVVEGHTYPDSRYQLSAAFREVRSTQSASMQDAFQRNARRMWRPDRPAGS